jgi:glycosyltransferase involved in cell wall biosynthesis
MKDIVIIAHFCDDFGVCGNNRFNYIAGLLAGNGFAVELITSGFSHIKKEKRTLPKNTLLDYKVTYITEPAYKKNVSFKRFYSHHVMAINLTKYLNTRKKPDAVYCAVPSVSVAHAAAKYALENNVKFIIDIQDLWPEAFKMVLRAPFPTGGVDYVYRAADEIVAVSKTYADRALRVNAKCRYGTVVYLGTDLAVFDGYAQVNKQTSKPADEVWLAYVGTLGHSYDLTCVIDALAVVKNKGIDNIKFIVMGDGPLRNRFERYALRRGVACNFTGRLKYQDMVGLLIKCDIAVNPISHKSIASIINKHADYAAAGLPVLNTQESPEYKKLIGDYQAGFNCRSNDPNDLAERLLYLYENKEARQTMGKNHRRLAEEKFDRAKTYAAIIDAVRLG